MTNFLCLSARLHPIQKHEFSLFVADFDSSSTCFLNPPPKHITISSANIKLGMYKNTTGNV